MRAYTHLAAAVLSVWSLWALAASAPLAAVTAASAAPGGRVRSLRVLVLSTMLADSGVGEWGFAALVEADGHRLLFDTGARPDTVLRNARELKVDLGQVTEVVLSHNHDDHTGGLLLLRRDLSRDHPGALSRAHVGKGIFLPRPGEGGDETNPMIALRPAYESGGGVFIEHPGPAQLFPGVWLTGPVPRVHPERNWSGSGRLRLRPGAGLVEDTIPEDQSLVLDTAEGLVVLSGCGHAGIINTLTYARRSIRPAPIHAALGGFHLFAADDRQLDWTAGKLREMGLRHLLGGHCTGIEAVFHLRQRAGLDRKTCVVAAVGSSFKLGEGIDPRRVAR